MTNEERDIITQFIARVGGAQAPAQPAFGGSVPATTTPALPPVDPEADRLIGDLFNRYPEARYRITQLAFVQEHALAEAQNRIQRLEWEAAAGAAAGPAGSNSSRAAAPAAGFFSGLFGGGSRSGSRRRSRAGAGVEPGRRSQRLPAGRRTRRRRRNMRRAISPACSSAPAPGSWARR